MDSCQRRHGSPYFQHLQNGLPSDPLAVADQSGRVYGIDGLRIVDASLMPDSVRANINATVMMMAEKIASEISGEN